MVAVIKRFVFAFVLLVASLGTYAQTTKVVVIPMFGDDDLYYTKAESNDLFLQSGDAAQPPTTQSRWTGCNGPSMNTPDDGDNTFTIGNDPRGYIGSYTNGAQFYCPLDLPQGASMNGFRALLRDTGPTGGGQGLARCLLQRMPLTGPTAGDELTISNTAVGTGLVGSNGAETPILLNDAMPVTVVDNASFVYFIKCDVFGGGSTTVEKLGIYLAQVQYSRGVVPGTNN